MLKDVSREEFDAFVKAYPRPLTRDVTAICEPPLITFNDFERAPYWPGSVVASCNNDGTGGPNNFRVLADINAPVHDDGKRDTDKPLFDNNGAQLFEGDVVKAKWGGSSAGRATWDSDRDIYEPSTTMDGWFDHFRIEKILIREKGTKYEHWSFESCHNIVRGFDMVKV
jgi:hypothetical protein